MMPRPFERMTVEFLHEVSLSSSRVQGFRLCRTADSAATCEPLMASGETKDQAISRAYGLSWAS